MTPFWGHDAKVAGWVASHIPDCVPFGTARAMGVLDSDMKMAGGIVYHNWSPEAGTIEMSGAAVHPRWLTREVLQAMFGYPFDGIGCQLAVMRISERNKNWTGRGIHRILEAIGFEQTRIPRLFGRDEDCLLFTLTDDAWRQSRFSKDKT